MGPVAPKKKDSLKRPTAVAVIIVIARRDGDKRREAAAAEKIEAPCALLTGTNAVRLSKECRWRVCLHHLFRGQKEPEHDALPYEKARGTSPSYMSHM